MKGAVLGCSCGLMREILLLTLFMIACMLSKTHALCPMFSVSLAAFELPSRFPIKCTAQGVQPIDMNRLNTLRSALCREPTRRLECTYSLPEVLCALNLTSSNNSAHLLVCLLSTTFSTAVPFLLHCT